MFGGAQAKKALERGSSHRVVVVHSLSPSVWGVEASGSLSSRPGWSMG